MIYERGSERVSERRERKERERSENGPLKYLWTEEKTSPRGMSATDWELSPISPHAVVVHVVRMGEDKGMPRSYVMPGRCRNGSVVALVRRPSRRKPVR